ncbi:MAG TPA: FtsK/SpoIIIE domain-containing protein [Mycobacteriales bacterium]|nr:FtsK/SpoIIIE domain-containing protein [Mycobacteriales bacterium]
MVSRLSGNHMDGWGVGWPAPPPPSLPESILLTLLRAIAGFWLELFALALILVAVLAARAAGLLWLAAVGLLALGSALIIARRPRRFMARLLHAQSVRRSWSHAVRVAAVQALTGRVPPVIRVRPVPAGDVLDIHIPLGATVDDLDVASEVLAVALRLRDVVVERDRDNAARARVTLVRRDPLASPAPPWPKIEAQQLTLWEPIPVGIDETGEPVFMSLAERNVLLGGEPGAGKSVALSMLVATAALDPTVRLHLFDGKLVELAMWRGCADHNVGVSTAHAIDVLRELQVEMDDRYLSLLAQRSRKVTPSSGQPLHVLVVDELAHYLLAQDRKERQEFAELLRDLVARGRAAGLVVLAATQKPSHDVIPTALRDLFGFRWALRCNTPQASDTVLGAGWASLGYNAADIDSAHRGVGYLLHEGGRPVRLRSHHIDDETLAALALRAEMLRHPERAMS